MKLSISNIAWDYDSEEKVLDYIGGTKISAIEIAPSKIWNDFRKIDKKEIKKYKEHIETYNLTICSMHSLFYNIKNAQLFGNDEEKENLVTYFTRLGELAEILEIPKMIFGSPSVRDRGSLSIKEGIECSAEVLRKAAENTAKHGSKILIEPLTEQETSFINTHKEGIELVNAVNSKGFGLHLDAKAINAQQESLESILDESGQYVEHFHVNEEGLGSLKDTLINHNAIAESLRRAHYNGYVSIEMRTLPNYMGEIKDAVGFLESTYGSKEIV